MQTVVLAYGCCCYTCWRVHLCLCRSCQQEKHVSASTNAKIVSSVALINSMDTVQGPGSIPGGGGSFGSSSVWDQPTPPYAIGFCFGDLPSMVCVYKSLNQRNTQTAFRSKVLLSIAICTSLPAIHSIEITYCVLVTVQFAAAARSNAGQVVYASHSDGM